MIGLSRLADIENKGVVPSLHRFYSLCAIYRLDLAEVLEWYGISFAGIWKDSQTVAPPSTHLVRTRDGARGSVPMPLKLEPGLDFRESTYLSRMIQQWGKVPLSLLDTLDLEDHRYGFIGTEDFMMYPLVRPGSLVQIDDSRPQIRHTGWTNEFERPIYFFELRDSYACSWCSLSGEHLILQPHPGSPCGPIVLQYPNEVDVIGRVIGVAMHLSYDRVENKAMEKARSAVRLR